MKKLISLVLTGAMAVGMLAGSAMTAAADDLPILGAGIYSSTDNFNSYIAKAIKNASEGVFDCNVDDGQQDQSTQLNQIDTAIAKGAVAIAVSMVDVTAAPAIIEKVKENGGLPVIFFNKEIEDKDVVNSYDNLYQVTSTGGDYGASIQGQMVIEYWKAHPEADKNGDGKIQLIDIMGDPGHTAAPPRAQYVKSTIEDAGIEIDLLEEDTGMWDTAKAKEKMDAWISKYGDEIEFIVWTHGSPSTATRSSSSSLRTTPWRSALCSPFRQPASMKTAQKARCSSRCSASTRFRTCLRRSETAR